RSSASSCGSSLRVMAIPLWYQSAPACTSKRIHEAWTGYSSGGDEPKISTSWAFGLEPPWEIETPDRACPVSNVAGGRLGRQVGALPWHAPPVSDAPQLGRLTSMTRSAPRPARKLLPAACDLAALAVAHGRNRPVGTRRRGGEWPGSTAARCRRRRR